MNRYPAINAESVAHHSPGLPDGHRRDERWSGVPWVLSINVRANPEGVPHRTESASEPICETLSGLIHSHAAR